MKIALFKNVEYDHETIREYVEFDMFADDYLQLSEFVEVDFPLLDKSEVNKKQVAIIDKQIQKVKADYEVKLNGLESYKAELLAIGSDS